MTLPLGCGIRVVHDVADVEGFEMPVKVGLEFGVIVGLNAVDAHVLQSPSPVVPRQYFVRPKSF